MDNIRVYINDVEVGYYKIEDTGVTFTWQAKLIGEINSFSTTTTKTITLPLTDTLKVQLKSPDVIDTTNSVSNREYFRIDITWNDTVAIKGYIKLQKVVILENDEYVELAIEPREKNWITQFKDFKLTELDFHTTGVDQEHALTYANIVASESYLSTREYVYAPIDIAEVGRLQVLWVTQSSPIATVLTSFYFYGETMGGTGTTFRAYMYGFNDTSFTRYDITLTMLADAFWNARGIYVATTTDIVYTTYQNEIGGYIYTLDKNYWEVSDFYPLVRHQAIVKRCFNRVGYGVTIVDNTDYFNSKYNFLHNIKQVGKFEDTRNKLKVRVQNAGFVFSTSVTKEWKVPFRELASDDIISSANYLDTNSNSYSHVDAGTNVNTYTATEKCILGFEWRYKAQYEIPATFTIASNKVLLRFIIRQYDSGNTLRRSVIFDPEIATNTTDLTYDYEGLLQSVFYMEAGDYISCRINCDIYTPSFPINVTIYDSNTLTTTGYKGGNYKNKTIRLNEYLPDIPAHDYIKDLAFINNWEFYTNEKLKQVYIVREDYKRTGKQIDFKDKLNRAKPVELEEIGLQWPKKSYFNWKKDDSDWSVKFIEEKTKRSLGTTYKPEELEMAARFGMGLITNLNTFTIEVQEFLNDVYAASLDKFDTSNRINFNTVEMKGDETWPHLPTWKRTDYEPRYLTVYFGETLEDEGVNGVTGVIYSIEGNTNHTTYPRVEFGTPLHYGETTGLIKTKYAKRERAIRYGWIFRGKFTLTENDVQTFVETYEDNNFRGDYELQLKGVKKIGELLKVNDFSPLTSEQTEIEFVIYRDDL